MNNNQFRRLLSGDQPDTNGNGQPVAKDGSTLGAKRSFSAMAPRTVRRSSGGDDFVRQFRERNAGLQPAKKFKSTAAPKGAKYGAGYTDRAKARAETADEEDDRAARIKALEEQMKLGQISLEMFEALRDKITGGDVSSTHLVKGLDRQLLERVKRGEDVLGVGGGSKGTTATSADEVDEELEKFAEKEIETVKHDKKEKKGTLATSKPMVTTKKSRDEIMAELKAQRKAAQEARAASTLQLDSRFRRIDEKQRPKVERDAKGREIITIVGPDGKVKKKVRKVAEGVSNAALAMPDTSKPVLGADVAVPDVPKPVAAEDSDDDIFEGVGTAYNPLAGEEEDDDESDESDTEDVAPARPEIPPPRAISDDRGTSDDESMSSELEEEEDSTATATATATEQVQQATAAPKRNYFNDTASSAIDDTKPDHKVAIEEVLKKAAKMDPLGSASAAVAQDSEEKARLERRAKMLANHDRDLEDMDIGFGGSRADDEEDGKDEKVRLSEWKGKAGGGWDDEDGDDGKGNGGGKKKRKPKKRKGDANNMGDIMKVIEGRKSKSG